MSAAETTPLGAAESGDHAAAMRLATTKGANVNATDADGSTAIMYAAANGDLELVRALIKAGANVKLKSQFGTSALTEASIIGSAPIIDALLKAGADPNFKTPNGETPLMAAARSGKVDAAKALLDAGADINAKETWGEQSALMWAAAQCQADMVKFLASKGANLNDHGKINQWERKVIQEPRPKDMNKGGFTALHYAAREGCAPAVQNLLAAGADPDSEDPDRETPLLLALENMHFDTAAVLVKGGADLDKWDLFGRSPVYMAADVSTLPMKGNGAVAVLPSPDKLTAVDVGRMMLEAGANPNIQLKRRPPYRDVPQDRGGDGMLAQGATPLLRAARGGDDKFVALLLAVQGAGRFAEQGRHHAVDGRRWRRLRHACHARTEPNRRRRARQHGSADQSRRERERPVAGGPRSRRWWPWRRAVEVVAAVEAEVVAARLLRRLAAAADQTTALPRASRRPSVAAVKCRARTPSRTKPLCTALPNTASTSSSNSSSPMART